MQAHPAPPLDPADPAFAVLATGLHRQLLGVPRQPLQHGEQLPPFIDSAYVVVSQAAAYDDWIASTIVATGRR
jgi:hypothetical protein